MPLFNDKPGDKVPIQMKGVMDCFPAYSHRPGSFTGQSKRPSSSPKSPPARSLGECGSRKEKTPMCQVLYMRTSGAVKEVHREVMEMLQVLLRKFSCSGPEVPTLKVSSGEWG